MKKTLTGLAVCLALAQWANAQMIIQHQGSNNPATEGFTSSGGGSEGLKFATNDNGTLAWVIQDTNFVSGSGWSHYKLFSGAQKAQLMNQWRVGWNFKVVAESGYQPFQVIFVQTNSTGNNRDYRVRYDLTNGTDLYVELANGTFVTLSNAGVGFHTYDLIRTNPASDTAQFYYDGSFITNYAGFNNPGEPGWVNWGGTGPATTSLTEWTSLFVEVPEPSALGLIAVGTGIGLLCRRRKQQR